MPRQQLFLWDFPSQVPGASNKKLSPVTVFLPDTVADGPSDPYMASILTLTTAQGDCSQETLVRQLPRAVDTGDNNGRDFFPDLDGDDFAADFMHVFTAARLTLELVRAVVNSELGWKGRWRWAWQQKDRVASNAIWSGEWEPSPLRIIAHAGVKLGASYYRSKRALLFFVAPIPELKAKLYSCRSMSMVVHETGHAILDAIDPSLYGSPADAMTVREDVRRACDIIHEAFADACWMFMALGQPSWCSEVLEECKGNLRNPCRANQVGASSHPSTPTTTTTTGGNHDEPPASIQDTQRSFLDPRTSWDCGRGVYTCSTVFVSFLWDSLVKAHEAALFSPRNAASNLHTSATALSHIFIRAVCRCVRTWKEPSISILVTELCNRDAAMIVLNTSEFQSAVEDVSSLRCDEDVCRIASIICEGIASAASARRINSLGETRAKQRAGTLGDW